MDLASLEALLATTVLALRNVRRAIEIREQNGEDTADLRALEKQYQDEIASLSRQIALAQASLPPAPTGAGETVATGARANDDRANTVAPGSRPLNPDNNAQIGNSNAQRVEQITTDANTNPPVKSINTSQSLPPATAIPGAAPGDIAGPNYPGQTVPVPSSAPEVDPFEGFPGQGGVNEDAGGYGPSSQGGVGAGSGDSAADSSSGSVAARINSLFGGEAGRIIPKANALDEYASYTYSISIYLLSPDDYRLMLSRKRAPQGWQLLIQSGGIPVGGPKIPGDQLTQEDPVEAGQAQLANLGRNEFFNLDYYIDDVIVKHLTTNRGTLSPHQATELEFKIFEPNGLTFLPNLYKATQQYVALRGGSPGVRNQVYSSQTFLMAIRFYGYDKDGNLVTASNKQNQIVSTNGTVLQTSGTATIEKFIPFQFRSVEFRVQSKIAEYHCKAITPQVNQATSAFRGRIPYNIELSSQGLQELLTGPLKITKQGQTPTQDQERDRESSSVLSAEPPPKSTAATRARDTSISQGLQEALNRFQAELVAEGIQEYPDIYEIEILEPVIASAKLVPPGEFNPRQAAMIRAQTAKDSLDGETQSVDTNSRTEKAPAGQSIVQFIDQAVRTSSYILEQQKYYIDQVTGKTVENATPPQTVAWFRIGLQAEPTNFYDYKRNDYQYKIKYSIAAYQVNNIKSDYFPRNKFRGAHKLYSYWFTGENNQIIDFQQSFNNLFYIVQNARSRPKTTSNYLEADRYYYQPLNPESSQGSENMRVFDGAASAASWLYSPGDQGHIKLKIVGDPAWIFQGEEWSGIQDLNTNYAPFLTDGTIQPTGSEVLFEVAFNNPTDYNLRTGLMDPGKFNYGTDTAAREAGVYSTSPPGLPRERYIYRTNECTSYFQKGSFTQELSGYIVTFDLSDSAEQREQKRTGAINPNAEQAQVRRVDNAIDAANRANQSSATPTNPTNANTRTAWQQANISAATTAKRQEAASAAYRAAMKRVVAPTSSTQVVGTEEPVPSELLTPDPLQIGSREA